MKRFFWFFPDVIKDTQGIADDNYNRFSWSEVKFYNDLDIKVNEKKTVFKLYHLKGMHGPNETDAQLNEVGHHTEDDEIFAGNILLIETFLNELRENGIYDNTVVVIMSDHGESYDELGDCKQNPLFMIKGFGERHDFSISDQRVSYSNIQEIFINLFEGKDAKESAAILAKDAERVFLRYDYDWDETEKKEGSFFKTIHEYKTKGDASDMSALYETKVTYSH